MTQFYGYCNKHPKDEVADEDVDRYLKHFSRRCEDWQVKHASEANVEFSAHNYSRVVQLLEPFENELTDAQHAKLAYARRQND